MSGDSDVPSVLGEAVLAWGRRGRLADLLVPLLEWLREAVGAERIIFFTMTAGGGYRVWASRNADRESIPDADRWISHFVVRRTWEEGRTIFFPETRQDRRFRTEGERDGGARIRSILSIPIGGEEEGGILYCDSRFRPIPWSRELPRSLDWVRGLLAMALRHEGARAALRALQRRVKRLERSGSSPPAPRRVLPARSSEVLRELDFHGFRTRCPELIASIEEIRRLAPSNLPILVEGESGTGKEVLARAIHEASGRKGPFITLHCGTVPESLVETELFGYARGAFTGAERERSGLLELARGGTLFLDDIGEMPPAMQAALLRVLDTGRYRPVSGQEERVADLRIISAILLPPGEKGSSGELRTDLYYRLAGATILVPALRERGEDILLLASLFVERHRVEGKAPALGPELEAALIVHDWPGNVRELENLVRRMLTLGEEGLSLDRFHEITGTPAVAAAGEEAGTNMHALVDRAERDAILRALEGASGNKSIACRMLGLSRRTLYRRMRRHGIPL